MSAGSVARQFIAQLGDARQHSVVIRNEWADGELKHVLLVALRGELASKELPAEFMGLEVRRIPWPKDG